MDDYVRGGLLHWAGASWERLTSLVSPLVLSLERHSDHNPPQAANGQHPLCPRLLGEQTISLAAGAEPGRSECPGAWHNRRGSLRGHHRRRSNGRSRSRSLRKPRGAYGNRDGSLHRHTELADSSHHHSDSCDGSTRRHRPPARTRRKFRSLPGSTAVVSSKILLGALVAGTFTRGPGFRRD